MPVSPAGSCRGPAQAPPALLGRAAFARSGPAQSAALGVIPPARPGLASRRQLLAAPGLSCVSLRASPGSSPPPSLSSSGVSLCTLSSIVLAAPGSLVQSLCLLFLGFYGGIFLYGGNKMAWGGWELEDESRELATEEAERAGSTQNPQPTVPFPPHPRLPVAAVVTDVLGKSELGGIYRTPTELASRPSPRAFPLLPFHLFTYTAGVGSNAVIPLSKKNKTKKTRLFSISFSLEFPVYGGKSASMKEGLSL